MYFFATPRAKNSDSDEAMTTVSAGVTATQPNRASNILSGIRNILVLVPANVVLNWEQEFHKWGSSMSDEDELDLVSPKLFALNSVAASTKCRSAMLQEWNATEGGVMIVGYNLFRNLATRKYKNKAHCEIFQKVCKQGSGGKGEARARVSSIFLLSLINI